MAKQLSGDAKIRAAFCLCRGGWARRPMSAVLRAWGKLPETARAAYVSRLEKLDAKGRDKFLAELGEPAAELVDESADDREVNDGRDEGSEDGGGGEGGSAGGASGGDGGGESRAR